VQRILSLASILLALASTMLMNGCGGSSSPIIMSPQIAVSVSAGTTPLQATATDPLTATVTGDSSGKGVTWTVSCSVSQCGGIAANATANGSGTVFNATYTAPSTPPTSDLTVNVKATSVADTSKSGSTTITVSAITLAVSPTTATLQAGAGNSVTIVPLIGNDPSGQGVSWLMSPASAPGNFSVQNDNAIYTAPATPPASDTTVTLTASSLEDSTKTASATITVASATLSVTPASATVDATGSVPNIVATLGHDPGGKGVSWSVTCASSSCGSVAPTSTASGAATTYSAPATPPPAQDLTVTVTATSVDDPAAQASMSITVKTIGVAITIPNTTVLFGQSQPNIVATVSDDPSHKGVTWSVMPCGVSDCGTIAPTATASGGAVTYSAPSSPPASDLSVGIIATSDSDPGQTASATIKVPAVTVVLSPPSASVPVGATTSLNATPFTSTIGNDSSNQGVSWTLTQNGTNCSPACGTISPESTSSGTPTIYAAPSTIPVSATVTITGTSVADSTKSANATITITSGTVKLIPATLDFGTLKVRNPPNHKTLTETLTNTGSASLSITDQSVTSATPFSITGLCKGSNATNVASGASCDISVTFTPTAVGTYNANLSITDDDTTSPQQIPLSGVGCTKNCTDAASFRSAIARNQTVAAPAPGGPSRIGTQVLDLDTKRSDPYVSNTKRELLLRLWYPAAAGKNCTPAPYTSPGVWNYLARLENVNPPQVKTNSCQDAPVASGKHPVVVFTHGYTGTFTDYTFLFEDLASRGYIVASVNHTYEATAVEFPGGRMAKSLVGSRFAKTLQLDDKATWFAVAARISDLKFVVDELQLINEDRKGAFGGKLDMARISVAGHSLGGMTALLALEMESRFRVALSIDGITPGALFGPTNKPVLMLFAGRDAWDQQTCQLWQHLQGPRFALDFKGSEHLTPSDAVWLAKGAVQTGSMGMEKTVEAIRNYVAAFLDANLKGDPADQLLQGGASEYPDVEITTQSQLPCSRTQTNPNR
jgi:dienelactone hydrolase